MKRKSGNEVLGELKRAKYYDNIKEARKDLTGSPESIERVAKARMKAQEVALKIRKRGLR